MRWPGEDRWSEVDALFRDALELEPEERSAFLERACGEDDELREAVVDLLGAESESVGFLARPVDALTTVPWDRVLTEVTRASGSRGRPDGEVDRSGERVGAYRLVRRLGRGGMATVYVAERADGLWEQRVALKLIRRGLDTGDVIRRFLSERQILSSLDHPNIARLLDGGTTEKGLPYLVMEYVEGTPITRYCDDRRLPVEERLRLFCDVGRAVQHAHRSLVVHRDLKPPNILVTDEGRVKLLDFGIAKLLDPADEEVRTQTGRRPLTPEYASPEQVGGGAITTASDVYQLGVLLYRLLSGRRPHGPERSWSAGGGGDEGRTEPQPPSRAVSSHRSDGDHDPTALAAARHTTPDRLARRLRGDLDTITSEALRPEPEERYPSVAALVEDIERHLEELPIRARPPTRRYRCGKFLKRNAWVVPTAGATVLLVAGYVFTMSQQARALERERNVARAEAARAEQIRGFMTDLFRSADPYAPAAPERGRRITVVDALDIGADRVRAELADRPALQADLFGAIADVYANLDLRGPAMRLREEALRQARRVHGPASPEVALHLHELGALMAAAGKADSAESLLRSALELTREQSGERDTTYAVVLADLGRLANDRGRHGEAARYLEEGIFILDRRPVLAQAQLASALGALSEVYFHLDRPEEAVASARRAVEILRRTLGEEHPRTALAMVLLGDAYDWVEDPERAVQQYRAAIPILERTLGPDHAETLGALNNLGFTLLRAGQPREAEEVLRRVLDHQIVKNSELHRDVADALQNLAATLVEQGKLAEAEATLERAHGIYVEVMNSGHFLTAYPLLTLSEIRLKRGDFAGAKTSASEATETLRDALPDGHYATAVAECRWGRALVGLGRREEATSLLERAARALAADRRAMRHEEECLEAAVEDLRAVGAPAERWEPFAERLHEIRGRGSPAG